MRESRIFRTLLLAFAAVAWLLAVTLTLMLRSYTPRAQYAGWPYLMAAAPDAKLAAGLDDMTKPGVWEPATGRQIPAASKRTLGPAYIYRQIVFSPDLKTVLVVGGPASLSESAAAGTPRSEQVPLLADGSAELWDLGSGEARWTKPLPGGSASPVFCSDGRFIAAACADGVHLWETHAGQELHTFATSGTLPETVGLELSPDGRFLAIAEKQQVSVWDTSSGARLQQFAGTCVALAPDGRSLAVGINDDQQITFTVSLRDLQTGQQQSAFRAVEGRMDKLWYSPDGRTLFTHRDYPYDNRPIWDRIQGTGKGREPDLFVIDAATGANLAELSESRLLPDSLTDHSFATRNQAGALFVWDMPPRRSIVRLASLAILAALPLVLAARWIYVRTKKNSAVPVSHT